MRKLVLSAAIWLAVFTFVQIVLAAPATAESVAAEQFDSARELFNDRDWAAAVEAYKALAEENPYNGAFAYRLGIAYYYLKRYQESADAYQKAADLGVQRGASYYNMGCCYALMGQPEKAIDAIEKAIDNGLGNREQLLREDTDLDSLRDMPDFRARILPHVDENTGRTEGWRIDLEYLTQRMEETHFDVYRNISKDEWRQEIDRIAADVPNMQDHEIKVALMQLVTRVGDGHTSVWQSINGENPFHIIPARFYLFKDGLFVREAAPEYAGLVGGRVVRIGNVSAEEALARVATVTQRDNDQQIKWIAPRMMSIIEILDGLDVCDGIESIELTVEKDGKETSATLNAMPYSREIRHAGFPNQVTMNDGASAPAPLYLRESHNNYWFEYFADEKLVYFSFNSVRNKDDESIEQFAGRLFEFIDENDVEALVIDVRLNNGGNNTLVKPLITGAIRSDKINKRGNLYMIIGRETFSACQNFTNRMQKWTNVLMVGEATGSSPNFVGEGNPIRLPYSGVTVNASSRNWQDAFSDDYRVWIAPDLAAEITSEDYRLNRDPAMEVIREYRAKRKKESS